ncbi:hypothetical protein DM02DRAFT_702588 [Periconia macrospinosa]|uniref:Uncharacterized protein n=1 Tax=Periconia macrospinosa TaxID=97972 RepID=A0A2V1D1E4_9PLEO|nr:hypothetical protein DM02DRAFT_702588 [Periconia macrospinosa]
MSSSDRVSLAGTVGTWVAAFLALIALVAIIGPVMIWAAARTERNKALHDAGDTKQPFIGSGIHFVGFDSRATWVQFASLLIAYGVTPERGDNLVIYQGKAILPVHRVWILVIGLIGRYTTKESRLHRSNLKRKLTLSVKFESSTQNPSQNDTVESITWPVRMDLNGTTGQIKITEKVSGLGISESSVAMFLPRPLSEFAGIEAETLSLQDLFMLAIGCLPLTSRQYIVMIELWVAEEIEFGQHLMDGGHLGPQMPRTLTWTSYINTRQDTPDETAQRRSMSRRNTRLDERPEPLALRLEKVISRDDELERLRNTFGPMTQEIWAFEPQTLDPGLFADLRMKMDVTFIDPSFEWVRLPKTDKEANQPSHIFFWRADAQKVAHALYGLPWHPQGYLIGGSSSAYCIQLLEAVGSEFLYLLTRVKENVDSLDALPQQKTRFKDTMGEVDKLVRSEQRGASLPSHAGFHVLDQLLSGAGHPNPRISDMIGVLMMTNEEFASFVRQSARHFDKSISGSLEVALGTGHVKVKLPFGGIQEYPVDMNALYTDWQSGNETISVNYTMVMLACLRASMRSYLLNIRFDGFPLMRGVLEMDDRVHVI